MDNLEGAPVNQQLPEKEYSLENVRAIHINRLKNLATNSDPEQNPEKRGGLYDGDQSLLYQLRIIERLHFGEPGYLDSALQALEKTSLLQSVGEKIGYRPKSFVFDAAHTVRKLPEEIDDLFEEANAIYVKKGDSSRETEYCE
ncbi:MAG: hypothetical protein ACREHC_06520 [Candidatus Levyibacteriota bacterium]